MNKKKKTLLLLQGLFLVCLGMFTMSCATVNGPRPYVFDKEIKKQDYGDPSNTTLLYGSIGGLTLFGGVSNNINDIKFVQLNPTKDALFITPGRIGTSFYMQPVPVGSSLKLVYFYTVSGRTTTYYYRGVQGKNPIDVRVDKPGLLYLGSFVWSTESYANTKKISLSDKSEVDFYPIGTEKEENVIKDILPYFKGTAWEPLLVKRLEELKK